jgi:Carboxypeptidase regulatory-like domain
LCFLNTKGQFIIQGTVSDSLNRPVNNVSVQLFNCDSLTIKSFTFTNTKGAFTIEVPEQSAKWCIGFSLLGYKETTVRVNQIKNNLLRVTLLPSPVKELKPIIVESPKFQIKGDTLLFNVAHYDRKDFKSIGDIIRNIPGITIDEQGTMFYNGTAISNYYISIPNTSR